MISHIVLFKKSQNSVLFIENIFQIGTINVILTIIIFAMSHLTQSYYFPSTRNQNARSNKKKYETVNYLDNASYQDQRLTKTLRWNMEENANKLKKDDFTASSINFNNHQGSKYLSKQNTSEDYLKGLQKNNRNKSMKIIGHNFLQKDLNSTQNDYLTSSFIDLKPSLQKSYANIESSTHQPYNDQMQSPKLQKISTKQLNYLEKNLSRMRSQKQLYLPMQRSYHNIKKQQYVFSKENQSSNALIFSKNYDRSYAKFQTEQPKMTKSKSNKIILSDLNINRPQKKINTFTNLDKNEWSSKKNVDQYENKFQKSQKSQKSKDLSKSSVKRNKISLDDFVLGKCKGEGAFGKVFITVHKATKMLVAIKQIPKQKIKYMIDQFITEIKIQMFLDHPNIVKLYGFFDDETSFYIIMEYMEGGNIWTLIKQKKKLSETQAVEKLKEVCLGLKQMHNNNILHRDIKPQNVVLTNDVCKICDFGWAAVCADRRTTYCGTLDYISPEIINGEGYDDSVDVWCIGVLAYEMLCGKTPFYNINRKQTMKKIMNVNYEYPAQISSKAKIFIDKILKKNPDERIDINQVLKHQLLSK